MWQKIELQNFPEHIGAKITQPDRICHDITHESKLLLLDGAMMWQGVHPQEKVEGTG